MRSIACGGAPDCEEVVVEGGREAQNRLHTQPTAGGRTLVDADRIKAARIGDPLGVDLTERACRPLIRLSTHPMAAAGAVRVSEPHPSTYSFFDLERPSSLIFFILHSSDFNPVPTPGHPRARALLRMRSAAGGGAPGCGVVVDESGGRGPQLDRRTQTTAARRTPMNADHVEAAHRRLSSSTRSSTRQ
ncbi:hypothetical protein EVAR_90185_1 [Eumeta japonica]|uniref:Uncharacterized protein n=1 Tax=Eumeta variegata TaxID=151549 RepID=A0A4C1WW75_EUMVA|nr:hypothetical protein EVAR_90185_1 [Eumeta japonica]